MTQQSAVLAIYDDGTTFGYFATRKKAEEVINNAGYVFWADKMVECAWLVFGIPATNHKVYLLAGWHDVPEKYAIQS